MLMVWFIGCFGWFDNLGDCSLECVLGLLIDWLLNFALLCCLWGCSIVRLNVWFVGWSVVWFVI